MHVTFARRDVLHTLHCIAHMAYVVFGVILGVVTYKFLGELEVAAFMKADIPIVGSIIDSVVSVGGGFLAGALGWAVPYDLHRLFRERGK